MNKPAIAQLLVQPSKQIAATNLTTIVANASFLWERLDTDSDELSVSVDKFISHYFKQPSYQHMLSHIQALGEADLARQLAIIQGSFHAQVARTTNENNHKW
ncbi:hypothetical protein [Chlorogloeopsis fritschii]|uniref:hypothetical protein n=1 Tax=Chlorogloeopsis fritschii TaxID=1124 RepID=UPI0023F2B0D0|nr:hypothetical protein [Chlorogloeopsis fritschii]